MSRGSWLLFLALSLSGCEYWFRSERVGAIQFDPALDDKEFVVCDPANIFEYYQANPQYGEGYRALAQHFQSDTPPLAPTLSGYFTQRFVINCEGETAWFRFRATDLEYQAIDFPADLKDWLLAVGKDMQPWSPGKFNGQKVDCYSFITLRIEQGKIVDLLP